ncbi:hypothetical protein QJS04_geneDACA020444 [Acorus gramineus]|uniref:Uncharacterized protein n=1 Tax=Acorus gramineus TaxID=55184 RepID=A0AAV9BUT0_ACOGR|nr:hypothetical protein QJS04_geneDACA020444 [Acorus gramineus]
MWIGMDVEASGGANQGHANIGALRAQSDMGDSNIHIQSVTTQTKMGDVSVNIGKITTNATSHHVGEGSTKRGRSLGVKPSGRRIFKPPRERVKCQARRGGGAMQILGSQSSNI